MSPTTNALIDYWKRLPTSPTVERRAAVEELSRRIRAGELDRAAVLPYALADADEHVVYQATLAYVAAGLDARVVSEEALADALEWIRRGLVLNRGAVFAALLSLDDETVTAALAGLRLSLDAGETAVVFRRSASRSCARSRSFLDAWRDLVGSSAIAQPAGVLAAA